MRMRNRKAAEAGQPIPPVDPTALPADLALCLDTATVIPRHATEDGLRAIVQIDSRGWVHDKQTTREQLLRRWPHLNDGQLRRAMRHIDALVRRVAFPMPTPRKRCWALNW
jgi:hypothetical protein